MNDRVDLEPGADATPDAPAYRPFAGEPDLALPTGMRLGTFEIRRVISRSASAIVYLATDHALAMPVAMQEYLPARLMRRDAGLRLVAAASRHEDAIARGLRAFVDEARLLARAEHPSLVRVHQLFHASGSAYRVMPVYTGQRLSDLRQQMAAAPDEAALRALLHGLLGALETIHRTGQAHGGVAPENILLLADDRPLLLGAGAASHEIGSDLVESLMAALESPPDDAEHGIGAGTPPTGASRDLYLLADVIRFCITAEATSPPEALRRREPLASALARGLPAGAAQPYSPALLDAIDAALSPFAHDRPSSVAQFNAWLARGVAEGARNGAPVVATPAPPPPPPPPPQAGPLAASSPLPVAPAAAPVPPADCDDAIAAHNADLIAPWPEVVRATDPPFTRATGQNVPAPPPLSRLTSARQRRYQWLLGGGLAGLATVVLAIVTGVWNQAPEINLGPNAQRVSGVPGPRVAPQAEPVPARLPMPMPVQPAPALVAANDLASEPARPAAPAVLDPAAMLAAHPPAAGSTARAPATRTAAASPSAATGGPRAACAGRTEFALYRCMAQQCQVRRWAVHPQCVRLRLDDRVD